MREGGEAGEDDLPRGEAAGHGVVAIELGGEAVFRPDGYAEVAVAEGHGLGRIEIRTLKDEVRAADYAGEVHLKMAVAPGGGQWVGGRLGGGGERKQEEEGG